MRDLRRHICFVLTVFIVTVACSNYRILNEKFVEKTIFEIKEGNFEQIYNESSIKAKEAISKQEFIERMKIVVEKMKEIDESLDLQKDERVSFDKSLYHEKNFAYRHIKKNGKELGINFEIDFENGKLKLKDFCVLSLNEHLLQDFNISECVTNAKSKI